ncbi:hypothetical protein ACN47E_007373 [Coniothyrium glycines]
MDLSVTTTTHGTSSKLQISDHNNQCTATGEMPMSVDRPMLPFAADATHEPEDPLQRNSLSDRGKTERQSNSDTQLGDVSQSQHQSKRSRSHEPSAKKKLTTSQAVIISVTNEVGIGMLSLPSALNVLGFFPGVLCIVVMGMLSLYTAYNLIQYWRKYPHMLNIVDYGRVLGGPWMEAVFATGFLINMALICALALPCLTKQRAGQYNAQNINIYNIGF